MRIEYIASAEQIKPVTGIAVEEAETHINFERLSPFAHLYTTDNTVITKMKKLLDNENYRCEASVRDNGTVVSYTFTFNKKLLSYRKAEKKLSEESKQKASDRFKKMWSDRKGEYNE